MTSASMSPAVTLVNGSFEDAKYVFQIVYTGETLPGWRVVGGTIDLMGPPLWVAADGIMSVDMVGTPARGAIAQDVVFDAAERYYIDLFLSRNPLIDYTPVQLGVWYKPPSSSEYLGLGFFEYGEANSGQDLNWVRTGTRSFTSEPGVTTFIFGALTGGGGSSTANWGGAAIDDVTLNEGESPYASDLPPSFIIPDALYGHFDGTRITDDGTSVPEGGPAFVSELLAMLSLMALSRHNCPRS